MGPSSRVCRRDHHRGCAVAIVVRSVLGRTACRGHPPHHDHHRGHRRGHCGRRRPPSPASTATS